MLFATCPTVRLENERSAMLCGHCSAIFLELSLLVGIYWIYWHLSRIWDIDFDLIENHCRISREANHLFTTFG